jgi:hypothetical protein
MTEHRCICTPEYCYGDEGEVDLCLHCHLDPNGRRWCPARDEVDE